MMDGRMAVSAAGVVALACVSLAVQEHSAPKVRRPPDVLADDGASR